MPRLIIGRILGNELPPRDYVNARLTGLQRILTQYESPYIAACERLWCINRVIDPTLAAAYVEVLTRAGEEFFTIPFSLDEYAAAETREQKLVAAIGINDARNKLIEAGLERGDYVTPLDGDCYFTLSDYTEVSNALVDHTLPYFSLRTLRTTADDPTQILAEAEPMLGFSAASTLRFDPAVPFGAGVGVGDKLELMYRLGHSRAHPHIALDHEEYTRVIGVVRHAATGAPELDCSGPQRGLARREALDALLAQLDAQLDVAK